MKYLLSLFFGLIMTGMVNARSPEYEIDTAIIFLSKMPEEDRPFIKFLTIYNIPKNDIITVSKQGSDVEKISLREAFEISLNFVIHSLSAENVIRPVEFVPGSDTLYWIDIRNYGWTTEAFDIVSTTEPYFVEPIIPYEKAVAIQAITADKSFKPKGFPVIRADWFIAYATDNAKQVDVNAKDTPLQYVLLYAKAGVPKTVQEFRDRWFVDKNKIEKLGILKGAIINTDDSYVALHNRQIARTRTELGYYYETSDVKTDINENNYLENLDPNKFERNRDAGEMITTNKLGLQVYFLTDGKGNRVEFADPTVARDKGSHDVRVKMMRSCISCHSNGLNKLDNGFAKMLASNIVELKASDIKKKNEIEGFYLANISKYVNEDIELYKDGVFNVTGYLPEQTTEIYGKCVAWYEKRLDLKQACLEWGHSEAYILGKIRHTTSIHIAGLFDNQTITRTVWDTKNSGSYTEGYLLLLLDSQPTIKVYSGGGKLMSGTEKIMDIPPLSEHQVLGQNKDWYLIRFNNKQGWINKSEIMK